MNPRPLRVVILTRISNNRGQDAMPYETQVRLCRERINRMGGTVAAVLHDQAIGGDRIERPGLKAAIQMIDDGHADALMVAKLDRFSRAGIGATSAILEAVRRVGGRLLIADTDLPDDPIMAEMLLALLLGMAAKELENTRKRVNDSLETRFRKAGRYRPGWKPLYGYAKTGTGGDAVYHPHPTEEAVVRRIFEMAAVGCSKRQIARTLHADTIPPPGGGKAWTSTTLGRILSRATYWTGQHELWRTMTVRNSANDNQVEMAVRPKEDRYTVPLPPIIDPDLAGRARIAQERNRWKTRRDDRDPTVGILRYGFIRCHACGNTLSVVPGCGDGWRYKCTTAGCSSPVSMVVGALDREIADKIETARLDPTRAASRWVEVVEEPDGDLGLMAKLASAEALAEGLAVKVATLAGNLSLVTGPAAQAIAAQLNQMNDTLGEAHAERDQLRTEAATRLAPARRTVQRFSPEDAISRATEQALAAGWRAVRDWVNGEMARLGEDDHDAQYSYIDQEAWDDAERTAKARVRLPRHDSGAGFHAWQAALASLGLAATLYPARTGQSRWVATFRAPVTETSNLAHTKACRRPSRGREHRP